MENVDYKSKIYKKKLEQNGKASCTTATTNIKDNNHKDIILEII